MLTGAPEPGLAADVIGDLDRRWDRVALVVVDALGWSAAERHAGHRFLRRVAGQGVVARLTAQFPSTTAAHMPTLHTGRPLAETGIYEWFQYEPALDAIIAPLLFSLAGDADRETLAARLDPEALFPSATVYERLRAAGVAVFAIHPAAITATTPSRMLLRGADVRPFASPAAALAELRAALALPAPAYAVAYLDAVDAAGHLCGPSSCEYDEAVVAVLDGLESLAEAGGDALLVVTADHGQVDVDPERTVFVNQAWPEISEHLRRGPDGRPLAPAGSARDLFLHVLSGHVDEVVARLQSMLGDRAAVRRVEDLLGEGLFGDAGERLLARLGDVVVLPRPGETVWWYEQGRFDMHFRGHHGGLSHDEMEIPLLALPLDG